MKNKKSQKDILHISSCIARQTGITLIALIITIIILLILAGVTLNLTVGDHGIIKLAGEAAEKQKIETAREKIWIAVADYEVKMRTETIYSILSKIEGLQSIDPDSEEAGLPYTIIVDGYEFLIKEGIEVIYQGKANGIVPEIIKVEKEIISDVEANINIEAKTEDEEGIAKIVLIKNGIEIETKEVSGKTVSDQFKITGNGKYKVKVVGNNKRIKVSQEIEVTEMKALSVTLSKGTVTNGGVVLTVKGQSTEEDIRKLEIYEGEEKIKEITYEGEKRELNQEYEIEYIPFYKENTYTAKVITEGNKEETTNEVKAENKSWIKTEEDLKKLAEIVNSGTELENQEVKQIANITLKEGHTVIGTTTNPFKNTYNGQGYTISNIQISNANTCQGLFGYTDGAWIINLKLGTGSITGGNRVGGLVGFANNSTITGITNEGVTVTSSTTYNETGYNMSSDGYGTKQAPKWTVVSCATGGICGKIQNTAIINCHNNASINTTSSGSLVGGIVGYATSTDERDISYCTNNATLTTSTSMVGGIVGMTYGNIKVERCKNESAITGMGQVGGIAGELIGGSAIECENKNNITGSYFVGGIIGGIWGGPTTTVRVTLRGNTNSGEIEATSEISRAWYFTGQTHNGSAGFVGGIVGYAINTDISSCSNRNLVNASSAMAGGIAGEIRNCTISQSYNKGNIKAATGYDGGITGMALYNCNIYRCYNLGIIESRTYAGGIVGQAARN